MYNSEKLQKFEDLKKELLEVISETQWDILSKGENTVPYASFPIFRKMVLDSFGNHGLRTKLERVFESYEGDLDHE